mgnify:CR=1 FL=1
MRAKKAGLNAATGMKRVRAELKAATQTPVEALLMLQSALSTFHINMDRFIIADPTDPLLMSTDWLLSLDLMEVNVLMMRADREGSQSQPQSSQAL